jgi:hypothetical protein
MKKNTVNVSAIVCLFFMLAACSKVVDVKDAPGNVQAGESVNYMATGSPVIHFFETPFFTQINTTTRTDSSLLIFDFTDRKSFIRGAKDELLLPFGDGQFYTRGWKYKISFDTTSCVVLVAPNDTMQWQLVPNSFKVLAATFDPASKTFNFITRFQELNGNKSEVAETVFKKW